MLNGEPNISQKRVVILTNFNSCDPAYSLNRVVQDQIKMFVRHGYNVKVAVADSFVPEGIYKHVELIKIPNVPCHNELRKDESFDSDVEALYQVFKKEFKDVDIILTHDVVYQPAALKHNFAARKFAKENPEVKWLHWIHSATSSYTLQALVGIFEDAYIDLVRTSFPNSFYIFFNEYSKPRIANNFGIDESLVKIVHHPLDVCGFFGVDPLVSRFVDDKKLLQADAICFYPCRLDRGKQVEVAIKTMAMLKSFDFSVRMIVGDFHSTGGDKIKYRDDLKAIGIDWGLNAQELSFLSEYDPKWNIQTEQSVVRDFMLFSNIMIMPSVSESYSLVTQEAASLGKIVVLNQDFPPFRDIFGPAAIYRKYSSGIDVMTGLDGWTSTKYGPETASPEEQKFYEKKYHKETAGMIAYRLRNYESFVLRNRILKERNLDAVFTKELQPLLFE